MDKQKRHLKSFLLFLICINLTQCQMKETPKFHVEICSPATKYRIEPVFDSVKTLEGIHAGLPYGGSSGSWGDSGSTWTEQNGTPIGAAITYYSDYEGGDIFYHLDVDFPMDTIKEYMERAYSRFDDLEGVTKEFKRLGRGRESTGGQAYDSFSTLVFGFAPKGMVVVWLNFGNTRIELGRYQAKIIPDESKIAAAKEQYMKTYRVSPKRYEVEKKESFILDASSAKWDNYRTRYTWRPVVLSENPKFRLFEILNYSYNGEKEGALRPWVIDMPYKERAIPNEMVFLWETGKEDKEKHQARIFFYDWEKTNEAFKKAGDKIDLQVKISSDNRKLELFLNNEPLEADSIRIYQWKGDYKESYK